MEPAASPLYFLETPNISRTAGIETQTCLGPMGSRKVSATSFSHRGLLMGVPHVSGSWRPNLEPQRVMYLFHPEPTAASPEDDRPCSWVSSEYN